MVRFSLHFFRRMFITLLSIPLKIFSVFPLQEILWISLRTRKMNEENQGNEANKGVLPETIDHGKRKMEEEEEAPNSREQSLNRSCASTVILNSLPSLF